MILSRMVNAYFRLETRINRLFSFNYFFPVSGAVNIGFSTFFPYFLTSNRPIERVVNIYKPPNPPLA